MRKTSYYFAVTLAILAVGQTSNAWSQTPPEITAAVPPPSDAAASSTTVPLITAPLSPELLILQQVERDLKEKYRKEIYIPPSIQSLVFSPEQQALLREARGGFNTQTSTEETDSGASSGLPDLGGDLQNTGVATTRAISLGGIVFLSPDDWTIWLNKKLVTSAKMPKEAIDLRVYKDFIELRWFDAKTNKIFPIRLRPNQTFNLDAQTFIPG